ncbi:hypothetical protein [Streptomyces sp. TR06-5]|uniref:hypothetical protein n=1 Tax=Streptomyces sp. TR06-5 TaxID=3385976 RepID=UPI0039A11752
MPPPVMGVGAPQPVPPQGPGGPGAAGPPMYPGAWQGAPGPVPYPGAGAPVRPGSGSPVGAFFLGLLASFAVALVFSVLNALLVLDQSRTAVNTVYIVHGLLNGAVVGWLVALVGRRSTGAHAGGAVVATLGAFFGFTNSIAVLNIVNGGLWGFFDLLSYDPLWPATAWWGLDGLGHALALVGLAAAAGSAWGTAHLVSRKRP